jgi:hypothetical protein
MTAPLAALGLMLAVWGVEHAFVVSRAVPMTIPESRGSIRAIRAARFARTQIPPERSCAQTKERSSSRSLRSTLAGAFASSRQMERARSAEPTSRPGRLGSRHGSKSHPSGGEAPTRVPYGASSSPRAKDADGGTTVVSPLHGSAWSAPHNIARPSNNCEPPRISAS